MNQPLNITEGTKPMTKTEARQHLADARRCLLSAAKTLTPPAAWMGTNHLTLDQRRRIFRAHIRGAANALAALADYEVSDR